MARGCLWLVACALLVAQTCLAQTCPNQCSGHGLCNSNDVKCKCFDGFVSGDCSERSCPVGKSWNDMPSAAETAHGNAVCSDRGICDSSTGQCICDSNFHGLACDKMKCPNACNGNGVCVNMKYHAENKYPGYGTVYTYANNWDATKIYGCECDHGFTGYDCSLKQCPTGDDPLTADASQVDEMQLIWCDIEQGFFTITYLSATSDPIPVTATESEVGIILNALPTIDAATVSFSEAGQACQTGVVQIISVTFTRDFGNLPAMTSQSRHGSDCSVPNWQDTYDSCGSSGVTIYTDGDVGEATSGDIISVTGAKENDECSGRGICDRYTGVCTCFVNWGTSNGVGAAGNRGDCGRALVAISQCPGEVSCSGHGVCNQSPTYKCSCAVGWGGGDCSLRTCPTGKAWFSLPTDTDKAHGLAVCSNMGVCDEITGACECKFGFHGSACQYLSCPRDCSGHGRCLSMGVLAAERTVNGVLSPVTYGAIPNDPARWDYDQIHSCICDEGFEGYDCSQKSCPRGDDPDTGFKNSGSPEVHEVQLLRCQADGGSFTITFREATTSTILFSASAAEVTTALLALPTVSDIDVTYAVGASFCVNDTAVDNNVVSVTFLGQLGDVPSLQFTYDTAPALLTHNLGATIEVAQNGDALGGLTSRMGTMENAECSNRGICNHETGVCACFHGYGSSNGNNEEGNRGDCGFKMKYVAVAQ